MLFGDGYALAHAVRDMALEALSPTRCVVCERPGPLVCDACAARIDYIDPRLACARCGAPFGKMLCTECAADAGDEDVAARAFPAMDRCVAAAVFEGVPARIVRAYKDAGERRLAAWIAQTMAAAALRAQEEDPQRFGGLLSAADALVFVPATARAYRRRGFDHMEAVAGEFAALTGLPFLDALIKEGVSDQRKLNRSERLARAGDLYRTVEDVRGLRLLLIDDVITTGATIEAAAGALHGSGAARVDRLAAARVW